MKVVSKLALVSVLAMFGANTFAAEPLTVAQMHEAARWATTDFGANHSSEEIYGFSSARDDEEGAIVRVYYDNGSSYIGYFCHVHDHESGDIDCHELD